MEVNDVLTFSSLRINKWSGSWCVSYGGQPQTKENAILCLVDVTVAYGEADKTLTFRVERTTDPKKNYRLVRDIVSQFVPKETFCVYSFRN